MWLPIELNRSGEIENGIRQDFLASLKNGKYTYVVKNRNVVNESIRNLQESEAKSILQSFKACSKSFIGTAKMVPCPPFVAFTVAIDLGIAYIEHFIDLDIIEAERPVSKFSRNLIESLCFLVFRNNQKIETIVVPFVLEERDLPEYRVEKKGKISWVKRT